MIQSGERSTTEMEVRLPEHSEPEAIVEQQENRSQYVVERPTGANSSEVSEQILRMKDGKDD